MKKQVELRPEIAIPILIQTHLSRCLERGDIVAYKALLIGIQGVWEKLKPQLMKKIEEKNSEN
jgi:hypothetical protein